MRSVAFSSGVMVAAVVVLCHCALDDRTPTEAVAANQPPAGGAAGAGAMSTPSPGGAGGVVSMSAAGASAGEGPGGAGSNGIAQGMRPGGNAMSSGGPAAGAGGAPGASAMGSGGAPDPIELPGGGNAPATSSGNCPAFTPCGGDLGGSWTYSDVCPTAEVGLLLAVCPTATVVHEPGGAAALSFSNGQVQRSGAPVGDGVVTFPAECDLGSCASLAAAVGSAGQCSVVNGDCACRTPFSIDWGQQTYTTSGTQLSLADGRTFEYCVESDRLTYRETGDAKEPGVFTLRRN